MSARKVDLLLPLLVVVLACGAVALVVGLTGTSATEPGPPTPFDEEVTNPPAPPEQPVRVSERGRNIPTMATLGEREIPPECMPPLQPLFPFAPRNVEAKTQPDAETQQKIDELQDRQTPWSQNK